MSHDAEEWKLFEVAVASFLEALAPEARIIPNAKLPDKQTGEKRQRDVWIELFILGNTKINILVSCKRHRRKLHQGDIDAFFGEISSSTANKGIIYSYSGFNKSALKKAQVHGISCCRLYLNQPADMPESLVFGTMYLCKSGLDLGVSKNYSEWGVVNWIDLLSSGIDSASDKSLVDTVVAHFYADEASEVRRVLGKENGGFPPKGWTRQLTFTHKDVDREPLAVYVRGKWDIYRAKLEATLLNGSYCITENKFVGHQRSPVVDTHGDSPGEGWELVEDHSILGRNKTRSIVFQTHPSNIKDIIIQQLGAQRIDDIARPSVDF